MWCVPNITPEFLERMEDVLDLYAKPYDSEEPILCFDEKSKQLLQDTRPIQHTREGRVRRRDYEYRRNGTKNIFVTVEPKGGWRGVTVTNRRTRKDFAKEVKRIIELPRYKRATTIHLVCDNLNTHFEKSFLLTFGQEEQENIMARLKFHRTPKHASWLNMAEIEISILERQCLRGRIPDEQTLTAKTSAWNKERNAKRSMIRWTFTKDDARNVFQEAMTNLS